MLMTVVLFVIGLLLIMFGGDRFVDAAVEISKKNWAFPSWWWVPPSSAWERRCRRSSYPPQQRCRDPRTLQRAMPLLHHL